VDAVLNRGREGIFRLALNAKQEKDYRRSASKNTDTKFIEPADLSDYVVSVPETALGGLFLKDGLTVDPRKYLRALWEWCVAMGPNVSWEHRKIEDIAAHLPIHRSPPSSTSSSSSSSSSSIFSDDFDAIVLAAGAGISRLRSLPVKIPITPCKGQNIEYRLLDGKDAGQERKGVKYPVISGRYLVPTTSGGERVIAGATFESEEEAMWTKGDLSHALSVLSPIIESIHPRFNESYAPLESTAGVRALPNRTAEGSIPICDRIGTLSNGTPFWVLTGLGSRGLLYHAYLSRLLASAILDNNASKLPSAVARLNGGNGRGDLANTKGPDEKRGKSPMEKSGKSRSNISDLLRSRNIDSVDNTHERYEKNADRNGGQHALPDDYDDKTQAFGQ